MQKRPWQVWYLAPWLVAHEACHYAAARLLGYRARLRLTRTDVFNETITWRSYVITLAPALVGWLLMIGLVALSAALQTVRWALVGLLFNMAWQAFCIRDFFCVWYMAKHGAWPPADVGPHSPQKFREPSDSPPDERG